MASNPSCAQPTARERRVRRNSRTFTIWIFVFTASFVAGKWILRDAAWAPDGVLAIGLSLVPLIPGAIAFRAFLQYVREADEMLREILVEGLVFGFGVTMVLWGAIQLPEHVWLPKFKADWVMAVLLLATSYGIMRAHWRRR